MRTSSKLRPGAWFAIAVGIAIALLAGFGALGQDRVFLDRQGDPAGQAVVFIPGLATPGAVFEPHVAARPGLDAHLVTLAGFGGAPALDPKDGVIEPGADAIAAYLREGGLEDVVLVGHSLGGQLALQVATRAPERLAHVVIVDSLPFFPALMKPQANPQVARTQGQAMRSALTGMERSAFLAMIEQGAPTQATSRGHQARIVAHVAQSDQATVAQAMFEAMSLDWRSGLDAVSAPVTLLVPHNDFIGVSTDDLSTRYRAQYEAIATVDVRIIADSRHFIMLDQPERFAEVIDQVIGDWS